MWLQIRVLNYAPGPLDTLMQDELRGCETLDTTLRDAFIKMKDEVCAQCQHMPFPVCTLHVRALDWLRTIVDKWNAVHGRRVLACCRARSFHLPTQLQSACNLCFMARTPAVITLTTTTCNATRQRCNAHPQPKVRDCTHSRIMHKRCTPYHAGSTNTPASPTHNFAAMHASRCACCTI